MSDAPDKSLMLGRDGEVQQALGLFLKTPDEPDDYFNVPNGPRQEYLNLFKENDIKTIIAGHLHQNSYGKDGDLEMITTGPVGLSLGDDPSGLRIVKVYETHIEHQYYGLNDVPKTISL